MSRGMWEITEAQNDCLLLEPVFECAKHGKGCTWIQISSTYFCMDCIKELWQANPTINFCEVKNETTITTTKPEETN